jgi:hypothetical protein
MSVVLTAKIAAAAGVGAVFGLVGYVLAAAAAGGAAFGPAHLAVTTVTPLPFAAATALRAGVAILIAVAAARTTVRRDVT